MPTVRVEGRLLGPGALAGPRLGRVTNAVARAAHDIEAHAKANAPVDTGFLRSSIEARQVDALTWEVIVAAHYGIFVELGTSRMAAQPFLTPAAELVRPHFLADLRAAVSS